MTTLAEAEDTFTKPPRVLTLEPWVFADEWDLKPRKPIKVGLRLIPDSDRSKARSTAEEVADEHHKERDDNWLDCFNDALLRQCCALVICSPEDVREPCDILRQAEDDVRVALTSLGAKHIYEAYERFEFETSPLMQEATNDELAELAVMLDGGWIEDLDPEDSRLVRRLALHMLTKLRS